jgi:predicted negative regulator of RcsB-dependent stress response
VGPKDDRAGGIGAVFENCVGHTGWTTIATAESEDALATYHSDDEEVEKLRRWWDENGSSVIIGVIIGLGALLGWRGWSTYQDNKAAAASTYYAELRAAVEHKDTQATIARANALESSFASTPYAALAALELAKVQAEAGDLKASEAHLRWAIDHSAQQVVTTLAKLRLARVLNAEGRYDAALNIIKADLPAAYTSLIEEIRGDALAGKGKIEEARQAYHRAILTASGNAKYLRLKRADLGGESAPAS